MSCYTATEVRERDRWMDKLKLSDFAWYKPRLYLLFILFCSDQIYTINQLDTKIRIFIEKLMRSGKPQTQMSSDQAFHLE